MLDYTRSENTARREALLVVKTKEEVLTALDGAMDRIRSHGVKRIGLFGSFVKGRAGEDSDVDFLVEFHPASKTFDNFMGLIFLLEDLLGRSSCTSWMKRGFCPN
jgi:predicted nucleotidyltransferase